MRSPNVSSSTCPEPTRLLALAEGSLSDDEATAVTDHLTSCAYCSAKLDEFDELSDTLVRELARMPVTTDDEYTFQDLQTQLLENPEPFTGTPNANGLRDTLSQIDADQLPSAFVLPFQLGNYELLEQIGAGAHGAVFRAQHRRLERDVAVKLLLRAASPMIDEFLNEIRIVGKLDHPNIIRATDAGEHEGTYFLVMEFAPGLDVSSLLRKTKLSVANACEIARQAAVGLSVAHESDLVHRDVKTSNLLFTARGQIKLLDLGLATIASRSHLEELENSGPRGTADYMSPEQWNDPNTVTARADIYSLGCTLFKLLVGRPPYRILPNKCQSKQQAHSEGPIPSVTDNRGDVPTALDQLVTRMMAKDPANRPISASEVAMQLERFAHGSDLPALAAELFPNEVVAPGTTATKQTAINSVRRLMLIGGVAGLAIVGLAAFAFSLRQPVSQLETNAWRNLSPVTPMVINIGHGEDGRGDNGVHAGQLDPISKQPGSYLFTSNGSALLHFGNPIVKPYRWQTELTSNDDAIRGVFFRLRRSKESQRELTFQTITVARNERGGSTLLWTSCETSKAGRLETVVLAEAELETQSVDFAADSIAADLETANAQNASEATNRRILIEVVVGRKGIPEVTLNGSSIPESDWEAAAEARELIVTSKDQLPTAYAGRIGVFQSEGRALCSSKLMYLDQ